MSKLITSKTIVIGTFTGTSPEWTNAEDGQTGS